MPAKGQHRASGRLHSHSRTNSANRLPTTAQFTQKKIVVAPRQQRPGFHIATDPDEDDDDDGDGEWTSESGGVTPNPHDDEEDSDGPPDVAPPQLARIPTARPADYSTPAEAARVTTPRMLDTARLVEEPTTAPPSPASIRRHSRPMSSHSMIRPELRPHPLIRGQSFGTPSIAPKPSPLLPVVDTFDTDVVHLTASPSVSLSESPPSPPTSRRRTSISSTRSVATVATPQQTAPKPRHRTFSTLSATSSAVSSLTHLPPISRPAPYIALLPDTDPQQDDRIHPLLPPPYVANHLTVAGKRSCRAPIREGLERVQQARVSLRI